VQSVDVRLVLTAAGEIDLSNGEQFHRALAMAVAGVGSGGESRMIGDLSGGEYLDGVAVNMRVIPTAV
jgi:anti-anti-sigma regulatory factor